MFRTLILCLSICAPAALPALGADTPMAIAGKAQMSKVHFLLGEWRGHGWMEGPTGRLEFPQSKIVTGHMENQVLAIEGDSMTEGNVFYRHTLVMVSFDGKEGYRIHGYGGSNGIADGAATVKDGTFEWGFAIGKIKLRYRIHVNDKQQWVEVGDRSMDDGATWHTFTELLLDKAK